MPPRTPGPACAAAFCRDRTLAKTSASAVASGPLPGNIPDAASTEPGRLVTPLPGVRYPWWNSTSASRGRQRYVMKVRRPVRSVPHSGSTLLTRSRSVLLGLCACAAPRVNRRAAVRPASIAPEATRSTSTVGSPRAPIPRSSPANRCGPSTTAATRASRCPMLRTSRTGCASRSAPEPGPRALVRGASPRGSHEQPCSIRRASSPDSARGLALDNSGPQARSLGLGNVESEVKRSDPHAEDDPDRRDVVDQAEEHVPAQRQEVRVGWQRDRAMCPVLSDR